MTDDPNDFMQSMIWYFYSLLWTADLLQVPLYIAWILPRANALKKNYTFCWNNTELLQSQKLRENVPHPAKTILNCYKVRNRENVSHPAKTILNCTKSETEGKCSTSCSNNTELLQSQKQGKCSTSCQNSTELYKVRNWGKMFHILPKQYWTATKSETGKMFHILPKQYWTVESQKQGKCFTSCQNNIELLQSQKLRENVPHPAATILNCGKSETGKMFHILPKQYWTATKSETEGKCSTSCQNNTELLQSQKLRANVPHPAKTILNCYKVRNRENVPHPAKTILNCYKVRNRENVSHPAKTILNCYKVRNWGQMFHILQQQYWTATKSETGKKFHILQQQYWTATKSETEGKCFTSCQNNTELLQSQKLRENVPHPAKTILNCYKVRNWGQMFHILPKQYWTATKSETEGKCSTSCSNNTELLQSQKLRANVSHPAKTILNCYKVRNWGKMFHILPKQYWTATKSETEGKCSTSCQNNTELLQSQKQGKCSTSCQNNTELLQSQKQGKCFTSCQNNTELLQSQKLRANVPHPAATILNCYKVRNREKVSHPAATILNCYKVRNWGKMFHILPKQYWTATKSETEGKCSTSCQNNTELLQSQKLRANVPHPAKTILNCYKVRNWGQMFHILQQQYWTATKSETGKMFHILPKQYWTATKSETEGKCFTSCSNNTELLQSQKLRENVSHPAATILNCYKVRNRENVPHPAKTILNCYKVRNRENVPHPAKTILNCYKVRNWGKMFHILPKQYWTVESQKQGKCFTSCQNNTELYKVRNWGKMFHILQQQYWTATKSETEGKC